MNNKFTPLDCDDDVVLVQQDTFKISRLKELATNHIRKMLEGKIYDSQGKYLTQNNIDDFRYIPLGEHRMTSHEFRYNYTISCQLLKIGSKGWQQGKLQVQVIISPFKKEPDKVLLEFAPDQVDELESPLDELRKQIQI